MANQQASPWNVGPWMEKAAPVIRPTNGSWPPLFTIDALDEHWGAGRFKSGLNAQYLGGLPQAQSRLLAKPAAFTGLGERPAPYDHPYIRSHMAKVAQRARTFPGIVVCLFSGN